MTTAEAKQNIKELFMAKYHEWLKDYVELDSYTYGRKYGWQKNPEHDSYPDNLKTVCHFQKYIFSGMWLPEWKRSGFDSNTILELHKEKFLSYQMYSNWTARHTGKTDFYYISQATAKAIWKEVNA